jgi:hypothetical protein
MKYRILYHAEAQESLLIAPEDCKIRKLKSVTGKHPSNQPVFRINRRHMDFYAVFV